MSLNRRRLFGAHTLRQGRLALPVGRGGSARALYIAAALGGGVCGSGTPACRAGVLRYQRHHSRGGGCSLQWHRLDTVCAARTVATPAPPRCLHCRHCYNFDQLLAPLVLFSARPPSLLPSLAGCGLGYYPDVSPAAYTTSRLHTTPAVTEAITAAEAAHAAATATGSESSSSSDDSAPAPARRAGLRPRITRAAAAPPAEPAASPLPATTPLEDVTANLTAALALLPDAARAELDVSVMRPPTWKTTSTSSAS